MLKGKFPVAFQATHHSRKVNAQRFVRLPDALLIIGVQVKPHAALRYNAKEVIASLYQTPAVVPALAAFGYLIMTRVADD